MTTNKLKNEMIEALHNRDNIEAFEEAFKASIIYKKPISVYWDFDECHFKFDGFISNISGNLAIVATYDIWYDPNYNIDDLKEWIEEGEELKHLDFDDRISAIKEYIDSWFLFFGFIWDDEKVSIIESINYLSEFMMI